MISITYFIRYSAYKTLIVICESFVWDLYIYEFKTLNIKLFLVAINSVELIGSCPVRQIGKKIVFEDLNYLKCKSLDFKNKPEYIFISFRLQFTFEIMILYLIINLILIYNLPP